MLKFLINAQPDTALRTFPKVKYIQQRLTNNLTTVVNFYRFKMRPVASSHPLVRLLDSFVIPRGIEPERVILHANHQAPSLGVTVKFGSPISKMHLLTNVFYSDEVLEAVFLNTTYDYWELLDYFDRNNITNWRNIAAVKVMTHPKTDLSLHLLNKAYSTIEAGYATIEINVAALIWQFKCWQKTQAYADPGARQTTAQFVGMYVIPNMLASHLEAAWFNRFTCKLLGQEPAPYVRIASIALPDTMTYVDDVLTDMVNSVQRKQYNFNLLWSTMPSPIVNDHTWIDNFTLPHLPPTIYSKAYLAATSLPWLETLFGIDYIYDTNLNSRYYTELRTNIQALKAARIIDGIGGPKHLIANRLFNNLAAYVE